MHIGMHVLSHTHTHKHIFHSQLAAKGLHVFAVTQLSSINVKTNPSIPVDAIFMLAIAGYPNLFTLLIYIYFFFSFSWGMLIDGWMGERR